jgi:type I restriction enzyme, S subunit
LAAISLASELTREGVPVLYSGDIREAGFCRKSDKYVTEEKALQLNFCRADPGDLLLAKVGDPPGTACVYPDRNSAAVITQDVVRVKLDPTLADPTYIAYLMNSKVGRRFIAFISVEATRGRFSLADLKAIRLFLPPLPEQIRISDHLQVHLSEIDALEERLLETVERLLEYRSALITDAVTGKIDVRGMVRSKVAA